MKEDVEYNMLQNNNSNNNYLNSNISYDEVEKCISGFKVAVLRKTGHVMIIFLAYLVLYATGSIKGNQHLQLF